MQPFPMPSSESLSSMFGRDKKKCKSPAKDDSNAPSAEAIARDIAKNLADCINQAVFTTKDIAGLREQIFGKLVPSFPFPTTISLTMM